jgi:tRNA (guanine-N7-)-methyltransferase
MRLRNIPRAQGTLQAHPAVIQKPEECKGRWNEIFGNENPVYIEIGMGKGQFLLQTAARNPKINFVGIERYSSVLLRAVEKLNNIEAYQEMENIRFICMDAQKVCDVFAPGEVGRIYLNFSDPWPKARHAKRRLTSKDFLARYGKILDLNGQIEFKTDNTELFRFSLDQIRDAGWLLMKYTFDLHHNEEMNAGNIMTEYEEKFSQKGQPVNKLIAMQPHGGQNGRI